MRVSSCNQYVPIREKEQQWHALIMSMNPLTQSSSRRSKPYEPKGAGKLISRLWPAFEQSRVGFVMDAVLKRSRWKIKLSSRLREWLSLRVALHNKSEYVIDVHRKNFTESDGLSHEECDALLKKKLPKDMFSSEEMAIIDCVIN
jgi:alkylhydroperoxidase/carboxymuconolactone decarboxylase family protein YurZ